MNIDTAYTQTKGYGDPMLCPFPLLATAMAVDQWDENREEKQRKQGQKLLVMVKTKTMVAALF